jgi:hypothetical protein
MTRTAVFDLVRVLEAEEDEADMAGESKEQRPPSPIARVLWFASTHGRPILKPYKVRRAEDCC